MKDFADLIKSLEVSPGEVAVFWLGQAGFVFKNSANRLVGLDLYLSDSCNKEFGFKRLMPFLLQPEEIIFDLLITSHAHYDHFDIEAMPELLRNGHAVLVTARDGRPLCDRLSLPPEQIRYIGLGDELDFAGINIRALPCDHGTLAPDAVGILLSIEGKRIYYTGDTAYREDYWANPELKDLDLLILPINGAYGNLNEAEAAETAVRINARMTVPCHFWNFAEHGGDPMRFSKEIQQRTTDLPYTIMAMGEYIFI